MESFKLKDWWKNKIQDPSIKPLLFKECMGTCKIIFRCMCVISAQSQIRLTGGLI